MSEVIISADEYKNLCKLQARVEAFADYVNDEDYSISRKKCAVMLGFELMEKKEND